MRQTLAWLALALLFALTTALLGWWTVPVVAALWGAVANYSSRPWRTAALAAAAAWALLLLVNAARGPLLQLAALLGGVFQLNGFAMVLLALIFPALLAWSAAGCLAALRQTLAERARAVEGS